MSRARIILIAVGVGALVGLFSPLLALIVFVGIAGLIAVGLGVWGEGREPTSVLQRPTPYALFGAFATVFWLIGRLGVVLGLVAAVVLVVAFFAIGGDLG
ncbi:MAG: hypothetical protein AAFZ07_21075 [Actinomycetota bacterium]